MKRQMGPELLALQERVERWRRERPNRASRIPQELWDEAARVVEIEGLKATARAIRFEYYALKKHVDRACSGSVLSTVADSGVQAPADSGEQASPESTFVQVQIPEGDAGLTIELADRNGNRVRIQSRHVVGLDVVGLVRAFWSRAS